MEEEVCWHGFVARRRRELLRIKKIGLEAIEPSLPIFRSAEKQGWMSALLFMLNFDRFIPPIREYHFYSCLLNRTFSLLKQPVHVSVVPPIQRSWRGSVNPAFDIPNHCR